jgi:4'-phosphopantetheinyl transferase
MRQWVGGDTPPTLSIEPPLALVAPGQIHVWYLEPPSEAESPSIEEFTPFTSASERERALRFYFPADRWAYITAQALLRWALAHQLATDPDKLLFRRTEHGRPLLKDPSSGLFFSLTHSRSLVAVAIACHQAVGVDTEEVGRQVNTDEIAGSYFSASEVAHLRAQPIPDRNLHFFVQWTLKESFLKAIGMGLYAPIDTLEIIPTNDIIEIKFHHPFPEPLTGWSFWASELNGHHLAISARTDLPQLEIQFRKAPRFWLPSIKTR